MFVVWVYVYHLMIKTGCHLWLSEFNNTRSILSQWVYGLMYQEKPNWSYVVFSKSIIKSAHGVARFLCFRISVRFVFIHFHVIMMGRAFFKKRKRSFSVFNFRQDDNLLKRYHNLTSSSQELNNEMVFENENDPKIPCLNWSWVEFVFKFKYIVRIPFLKRLFFRIFVVFIRVSFFPVP